jgi:predicted LPLAT superfamily acyltransferase
VSEGLRRQDGAISRPLAPAWLEQRERGSQWLMALLARLTLALGRGTGRLFLPVICLYFLAFGPRARAASSDYLARVHGRRARLGEIYRHIHTFASTIHDRVPLLSGRTGAFELAYEGEPAIVAALAQERGCILVGAHFGSFEVLRVLGAKRRAFRINMLMATGNAARIQSVFRAIQPELAGRIIEMGAPTSLLRVKECLERGEIVGILADRSRGNERTVDVPFLGSPARFPLTPFRLATTLGVPIVLGIGLYRGGNRYSLHFEQLDEPGDRERAAREDLAAVWLGRYVARLEHYCRLAPYNWFNFFPFWPGPLRD